MRHADFEGELRYSYLRAKVNELLCLLEVRSARLSEKQPTPSYRMSQTDRHNLKFVRQHIENNPAGDLSIEVLTGIAGCRPNRTTVIPANKGGVHMRKTKRPKGICRRRCRPSRRKGRSGN